MRSTRDTHRSYAREVNKTHTGCMHGNLIGCAYGQQHEEIDQFFQACSSSDGF